ncbi:MAG: glycosyltransferase [Planctomycetia bacterium]|nr:glycosyltransferase [Planctomycetia bacterium]
MHVLVDGLSATSYSGRHVLLGHLEQLAAGAAGRHEFFVLYHSSNAELRRLNAPNVHWLAVPESVRDWKRRLLWQAVSLNRVIRETRAHLIFNPAGTVFPSSSVPQVSLAQNPWCLTPSLHQSLRDRGKAFLQRRAYRHAVSRAALMAYNSEFMRQAYRRNAGGIQEHDSLIAYQGLDDETHDAALRMRDQVKKQRLRILAVSVMAPWKNVESLLEALRIVRGRKIPAKLNIVGPWSDPAYERRIRQKVSELDLDESVCITGRVPREELYRQYSEAAVFCLLSRCESFGIPALEAQLFGAPAVISDACAMPEICGAGALGVPADDVERAAGALVELLDDERRWNELSERAVENASRFRWPECSRPLLRMFDLVKGD